MTRDSGRTWTLGAGGAGLGWPFASVWLIADEDPRGIELLERACYKGALEAHLEDIAHNHGSTKAATPRTAGAMPPQCSTADLVSAFSAADELAACRDASGMLRLAIELARDRLGLERVGLFMRDKGCDRIVMRGTWGTGARGETTDERSLFHEFAPREYNALLGSRLSGGLGMYRPQAPLFATEPGRTTVIGEGWIMATPLVAARDIVGVMYNDAAFTHSPVDDGKQAAAAVLCTMLALLYQSRRHSVAWQPLPRRSGQSALVERVLRALSDDLPVTGERLAGEFGVSSGHLARCFKREMGVSLVDYRNRVRLDKFFEVIQRRGNTTNLLDAALEAGFGSYAQFHRVYRRFLGSTPRDAITGNSTLAVSASVDAARSVASSSVDSALPADAAPPPDVAIPRDVAIPVGPGLSGADSA